MNTYVRKGFLISMTLLAFFSVAFGQSGDTAVPQPGKQVCINEGLTGDVIDNYWLYLPRGHNDARKWPVILFLQGGNGISPDSSTSKVSGPARYVLKENENPEFDSYVKDSFIVINPHMRPGSYWERQWYQQYNSLNSILEYVIQNYSGDTRKVYVTGLSRGGNGTWGVGASLNHRIAAIVPVCGISHGITDYSCFGDLPVWTTHCTGDKTHDYNETVEIVSAIEETTGARFLRLETASPDGEEYLENKHIFTTFKKESHNAWSETYDKVEIYKWLLKQIKEE